MYKYFETTAYLPQNAQRVQSPKALFCGSIILLFGITEEKFSSTLQQLEQSILVVLTVTILFTTGAFKQKANKDLGKN